MYILLDMAMSIKNPEVTRLARELADQTGETLTDAIGKAVAERLARLAADADSVDARVASLLAIGSRIADRLPDHLRDGDPTDSLYDDQGRPS